MTLMLRALAVITLLLPFNASAQVPSKADYMRDLDCKEGQECKKEPTVRKRGFGSPQPKRRSFTFEPLTEPEKHAIDKSALAGKLPSADAEVYFDFDKAEITPRAQASLQPVGEALSDPKFSEYVFVLVGHTDAVGPDTYNQPLSERRAAAVRDYLVSTFKIAPDRIASYGRGRTLLKNPANPNASENRRVQIINPGPLASR